MILRLAASSSLAYPSVADHVADNQAMDKRALSLPTSTQQQPTLHDSQAAWIRFNWQSHRTAPLVARCVSIAHTPAAAIAVAASWESVNSVKYTYEHDSTRARFTYYRVVHNVALQRCRVRAGRNALEVCSGFWSPRTLAGCFSHPERFNHQKRRSPHESKQ